MFDWIPFPALFPVDLMRLVAAFAWADPDVEHTTADDWRLIVQRSASSGVDALHMACARGHLAVVEWAWATTGGLDQTQLDLALAQACEGGHLFVAELMCLNGAGNMDSALWLASRAGQLDVVKWAYERIARSVQAAFNAACGYGHEDVAAWLFAKDSSLNVDTAFVWACKAGQLALAKWLRARGVLDSQLEYFLRLSAIRGWSPNRVAICAWVCEQLHVPFRIDSCNSRSQIH